MIKKNINVAHATLTSTNTSTHPIDKDALATFVIESTSLPIKDPPIIAEKYTINITGLAIMLMDLNPSLTDRSMKTCFTKLANALKKVDSPLDFYLDLTASLDSEPAK